MADTYIRAATRERIDLSVEGSTFVNAQYIDDGDGWEYAETFRDPHPSPQAAQVAMAEFGAELVAENYAKER